MLETILLTWFVVHVLYCVAHTFGEQRFLAKHYPDIPGYKFCLTEILLSPIILPCVVLQEIFWGD